MFSGFFGLFSYLEAVMHVETRPDSKTHTYDEVTEILDLNYYMVTTMNLKGMYWKQNKKQINVQNI